MSLRLRLRFDDVNLTADVKVKQVWTCLELKRFGTVSDLHRHIKENFLKDRRKFRLFLDDFLVPKNESIRIFQNGDLLSVKSVPPKQACDEVEPMAVVEHIRQPEPEIPHDEMQTKEDGESVAGKAKSRKRRRKRKSKNKNKLNETQADDDVAKSEGASLSNPKRSKNNGGGRAAKNLTSTSTSLPNDSSSDKGLENPTKQKGSWKPEQVGQGFRPPMNKHLVYGSEEEEEEAGAVVLVPSTTAKMNDSVDIELSARIQQKSVSNGNSSHNGILGNLLELAKGSQGPIRGTRPTAEVGETVSKVPPSPKEQMKLAQSHENVSCEDVLLGPRPQGAVKGCGPSYDSSIESRASTASSSPTQDSSYKGLQNLINQAKERFSTSIEADIDPEKGSLVGELSSLKVGNVIAYRKLELSATYEPEMSSYVLGKVLALREDEITLQVDQGFQCKTAGGKFEMEIADKDADRNLFNIFTYLWKDLFQPRLIK